MNLYPYLSEFLGTMILVFMGESTNAANLLQGSLFKNSGDLFTFFGWGLAVALPVMCFHKFSGAYFNPAVTIAYTLIGTFPAAHLLGYVTAQMLGGFVGACLVYVLYFDQFRATKDGGAILGVFVTGPLRMHPLADFWAEAFATMILVIYSINVPNLALSAGGDAFYTNLIILSMLYSCGGVTGLAMNPARDLSPRIANALLPIKHKTSSDWSYASIPVLGPIVGAIFGAVFGSLISMM